MGKETETKDQNNKLDEKESQPAVSNNRTEESCSNEEKQIMSKSIGTQDVPCDIKGVLVHVQLSHITFLYMYLPNFRVLCRCMCNIKLVFSSTKFTVVGLLQIHA